MTTRLLSGPTTYDLTSKTVSKNEPNDEKLGGSKVNDPQAFAGLVANAGTNELQSARSARNNGAKKADKDAAAEPVQSSKDAYQSIKKSAQKSTKDRSQEKMSPENTLKEVPNRMPELELQVDEKKKDPIFTNDQLL
ncbi:hypothetical protein QR680_018409 [Steinernema hermaphroditum]|uniref:Uncharacterized protein n=1 Tax=Steinernema hermaphroditum TaxID=289476 RepID=A0AA39LQA5_9BILA|nr:hypothetical protein QR680_018409 [Steinernema hermaphroditum]